VAVPVFGRGGEVVAAIELTVRDLGKELQQVKSALSIAARSLSRELAWRRGRRTRPEHPRPAPPGAAGPPARPALSTSAGREPGAGPRAAGDAGRVSATPRPTALATVCISGTLEDKLAAAAGAGFDGVEVFEPDLLASSAAPGEVRSRCADLGLSIELYQPFRDFDDVRPERVEANLRRARHKFDVMARLGADLLLVCSSVSPHAVDDDDRIAEQLRRLADAAAERGIRIAYEALAWGTHVNTYDRTWRIVRRADHPALGLCLDSFHILSRRSDPAGIRAIPADKLFFLQLADAPVLHMDVLQWSRHHRLFPGQGAFDLPAFLGHVLAAGYAGPLSLEIFNDVFRQADPARTAVDARRSLLALQDAAGVAGGALPPTPRLAGYAFTELAVDATAGPAITATLGALGFARTGRHRSKPVQRWSQGAATVLLNATPGTTGAAISALGLETPDPAAAARRAAALLAPTRHHPHGPGEAELAWVAAPDGTEIGYCRTAAAGGWTDDFEPTADTPTGPISHIDHVALTQPYDQFDEAALFYRSLLGLSTQHASEVAAPFGLVRTRAVSDPALAVRVCLSVSVLRRGQWAPAVRDPQHIAFAPTTRSHWPAGPAPPAPRSSTSRRTTTTTSTPASRPRRTCWPPCARPGCSSTATSTASSGTSTPSCWAGGCSWRSCSASGATPGTGRSTRRSGWQAHRRARRTR
jgi:4-hydroxyphenylpyruvate dioxygenase